MLHMEFEDPMHNVTSVLYFDGRWGILTLHLVLASSDLFVENFVSHLGKGYSLTSNNVFDVNVSFFWHIFLFLDKQSLLHRWWRLSSSISLVTTSLLNIGDVGSLAPMIESSSTGTLVTDSIPGRGLMYSV